MLLTSNNKMREITFCCNSHLSCDLKSVTRVFLSSLLFSVFFMSVSVFGQDYKTSENNSISVQSVLENEFDYMQIHNLYKWHLDPISFVKSKSPNTNPNDLIFLMDTIHINSVNTNPKRITNTYNAERYKESILTEVTNGTDWENSTLESFTYDENGNTLTTLSKYWQNESWNIAFRTTYIYTSNNNVESYLGQIWENGNWVNNERGSYNYDTYGNKLSYYKEAWNNGIWNNLSNELYTYDNSSNMLTAFGQLWTGEFWRNDQQYTYTYDGNGNMLTGISEKWENSEWTNFITETYTYNSANKRTSLIVETWDNDSWLMQNRYTYSYNGLDYLVLLVGENWEDSNWANSFSEEFTYNTYGGVESGLNKVWDTDTWVNSSLNQYNYDEFGNSLVGNLYSWDNDTWMQNQDGLISMFYNYSSFLEYYVGYRIEVNYLSITVGLDETSSIDLISFSCGPNPAFGSTTLSLNMANESFVNIGLYDISGKRLQTVLNGNLNGGNHYFTILTEQLPAGTYFVALRTMNNTKTLKIIVSK